LILISRSHSKDMPKCPVPGCQKEFVGDQYVVLLARHLRMVHNGYKLQEATALSLSLLTCSLCGQYFAHSRGLTRHLGENHPNSQLPPVFSDFASPTVTPPGSSADQPSSANLVAMTRCTFVLVSANEDQIRLRRQRYGEQEVKGIDGKEVKEREVKEREVQDQPGNSSSSDCSICQDPLLDPQGCLQPCRHTFHLDCISEWLAQVLVPHLSCPRRLLQRPESSTTEAAHGSP